MCKSSCLPSELWELEILAFPSLVPGLINGDNNCHPTGLLGLLNGIIRGSIWSTLAHSGIFMSAS